MIGVNPMAPRFLAGVKIDGVSSWCPCNYCLWPSNSGPAWEEHMNQYHYPFAGNLRDQPIKYVFAVREVRDADHPLDSYFICEAVEKKAEAPKKPEKKKAAPPKKLLSKTQREERQEMNRAFRAPVCGKCKTRHFRWESHAKKKDEVLEAEVPKSATRGKTT